MLKIGEQVETKIALGTSGATVTYTVYDEADGSFDTGSMTEIGVTGIYTVSWTPDAEGHWTVHMTCNNPSTDTAFVYHVAKGIEYGSEDTASTHNITTANDQTETQIFETTETGLYNIAIKLDLDTLETAAEGGTVTFRIYEKVDGSNYPDIPVHRVDYTVGSEKQYPNIYGHEVHGLCKLTVQCSSDVTTTRAIAYRYVIRETGS